MYIFLSYFFIDIYQYSITLNINILKNINGICCLFTTSVTSMMNKIIQHNNTYFCMHIDQQKKWHFLITIYYPTYIVELFYSLGAV